MSLSNKGNNCFGVFKKIDPLWKYSCDISDNVLGYTGHGSQSSARFKKGEVAPTSAFCER